LLHNFIVGKYIIFNDTREGGGDVKKISFKYQKTFKNLKITFSYKNYKEIILKKL